jgi:hypothetical protein
MWLDVVHNAKASRVAMVVELASVTTPANVMTLTGVKPANASNALRMPLETFALEKNKEFAAAMELALVFLDSVELLVNARLVLENPSLALDLPTETVDVMELVLATKDGLTLLLNWLQRPATVLPNAQRTVPVTESANVVFAIATQNGT